MANCGGGAVAVEDCRHQIEGRVGEQVEPLWRTRNRTRSEAHLRRWTRARPGPSVGSRHEPSTNGISLYVPEHPKQLDRIVDRHALEPALIDRPGVAIALVEVAGMCARQPLQVRRYCAIVLWPEDQMPVVWHQRVRDHSHRYALCSSDHKPLKRLVISGCLEEHASPHPSIEHVVDMPTRHLSSLSCHAGDDGKVDAGLAQGTNGACEEGDEGG